MAKTRLRLVGSTTVNRTVARRRPNAELRSREYLTDAEVARLSEAAKGNRYGHRDATMILVAYRHGLRAAELVDLRWDQIDFTAATLAVRRVKRGIAEHASDPRRRIARVAEAAAGARAQVDVRIHFRARCAVHRCGLREDGRAGWPRGKARL
jgi:integrase